MISSYLQVAEELKDNPGQWQVFESKGNCVALAGPGSGKTKALTIKLARMLANDVRPPRGIACITYSNECVRELRERLDKLIVSHSSNLYLGTIHSFCLANILKPYARLAGLELPEPLRIAGPDTQNKLFAAAVEKVLGKNSNYRRPHMDAIRRSILDRDSEEWRDGEDPAFSLIDVYEDLLRDNGFIDFDDMVLLGQKLIHENSWIRAVLKARFPILVIDEYQDLGLPLHQIVLDLCLQAGIRLLAVGDPDQSIYGFAGAQPHLLRNLAKMEEVESVTLKMNYRCGKTIVRGSEGILGLDEGEFVTPEGAADGTVDVYEFPNGFTEQAQAICHELIPNALNSLADCRIGDIAILYLDKNIGDVVATAAKSAGYEFVRIDKNAPYRKTPLTRWLEECARWCAGGWKEGEPRLSSIIRTWMVFNGQAHTSNSESIALRRQLVRFIWSSRKPDQSLRTWLNEFDTNCLNVAFYPGCEFEDEWLALKELRAACDDNKDLYTFTLGAFGGQGGSPSHLNLLTLHSAKGLEFKVVFLVGMDQGRIPWQNDSGGRKDEKRRLFYVGVTRAKLEVHITYSGWYEDYSGCVFR